LNLIRVGGIIDYEIEERKMFRRLALRLVKTEHLLIALWELKHDHTRGKSYLEKKVKAELLLARELIRRNVKFWA
jgi:hypothetical protein